MASPIDLHTHTTASDGTLEPLQLFEKALALKIRILSVTDHDSTAGLAAIQSVHPQHPDLRLIPGIEMSAEGPNACHLLGYFINPDDSIFQKRLEGYRLARIERVRLMADRLRSLGLEISFDRVMAFAHGGSLGRPHLADALVERGYVRSRQEAFDRYLRRGGTAYVPGDGPASEETIRVIREAGGIPVLAHPSYYTSKELVKTLVDQGLGGIEAFYPEHSRALIQAYCDMAKMYDLVVTGGSDFHGPRTGRSALGCVAVPETVVTALEDARTRA
jgi:3',5'-nucleoside bisphosphate phosphatase